MFWRKNTTWIAAVDRPDDVEFTKYVGRHFRVKDDNGRDLVIEAERIVGSLAFPWKAQIHAKGNDYLISMLDFYAQVNGEGVTQEAIAEFELTFKNALVKKVSKIWQPPWVKA